MTTTSETAQINLEWDTSDRLRKVRRATGLAQAAFAASLGVEKVTYSAWEAGNGHPRNIVGLARTIEAVYGVPAWWILGLDDPAGLNACYPTLTRANYRLAS